MTGDKLIVSIDKLCALAQEFTEAQTVYCTVHGHNFQAGLFEYPVCVVCGARHTDRVLPEDGVPVFIWYTRYPMLVYRRGDCWYNYVSMETIGVLSGAWRHALPHEVSAIRTRGQG